MASRRTARVAQAIRETISTAILFKLKDPRVRNVTVLGAEVTDDLRAAKVFVSIMGGPKVESLTMHGLESARGFLQSEVAERLQTRYTPILKFVLDPAVKKSIEASRTLREVLPEDPDAEAPESSADDAERETRAESSSEESEDEPDDDEDDPEDERPLLSAARNRPGGELETDSE